MPPQEEYQGEFARIKWASDEGDFIIGQMADGNTIKGAADPALFIAGMEYSFSGRWKNHQQFGQQFEFKMALPKDPVTPQAVSAYLQRYLYGKGNGIGFAKGRKLIAEIGAANVLGIIKTDPERIAAIAEIPIDKAKLARDTLIDVEKFENTRMGLAMLFQGRGFTQKCIDMAIDDFGVAAVDRIKRDPFTLLVRGYPSAGFLRCDQLWRDLGLNESRLKRQVICLWNVLREAGGDTWVEVDTAVRKLREQISSGINPVRAIKLGCRAKWLSRRRDENDRLFISERVEAVSEFMINRWVDYHTNDGGPTDDLSA